MRRKGASVQDTGIPLRFQNKVYIIRPDLRLVQEVENELGSLVSLRESFSCQSWKVSELVTLTHILLQAAGETVDYFILGNSMLKEGLERYLSTVLLFLQRTLHAV